MGVSHYLTDYGVTRQAIVNELSAHEHDNYYLGTRYVGGDVQSPNGDTSYNGSAGMKCGGFVGYVLRKVGLNSSRAIELIKSTGDALGRRTRWAASRPWAVTPGRICSRLGASGCVSKARKCLKGRPQSAAVMENYAA